MSIRLIRVIAWSLGICICTISRPLTGGQQADSTVQRFWNIVLKLPPELIDHMINRDMEPFNDVQKIVTILQAVPQGNAQLVRLIVQHWGQDTAQLKNILQKATNTYYATLKQEETPPVTYTISDQEVERLVGLTRTYLEENNFTREKAIKELDSIIPYQITRHHIYQSYAAKYRRQVASRLAELDAQKTGTIPESRSITAQQITEHFTQLRSGQKGDPAIQAALANRAKIYLKNLKWIIDMHASGHTPTALTPPEGFTPAFYAVYPDPTQLNALNHMEDWVFLANALTYARDYVRNLAMEMTQAELLENIWLLQRYNMLWDRAKSTQNTQERKRLETTLIDEMNKLFSPIEVVSVNPWPHYVVQLAPNNCSRQMIEVLYRSYSAEVENDIHYTFRLSNLSYIPTSWAKLAQYAFSLNFSKTSPMVIDAVLQDTKSLPKLSRLFIDSTRLTSLPQNIGDLINLTNIEIEARFGKTSPLKTLPLSLAKLNKLKKCFIDPANQLEYLPKSAELKAFILKHVTPKLTSEEIDALMAKDPTPESLSQPAETMCTGYYLGQQVPAFAQNSWLPVAFAAAATAPARALDHQLWSRFVSPALQLLQTRQSLTQTLLGLRRLIAGPATMHGAVRDTALGAI